MARVAKLRIWRGDASGGQLRDYDVPWEEGMVLLDVLHVLQATQAGDLAVRWNCKAGKCGSCSAEVNGKPRLMCMTRVPAFKPPPRPPDGKYRMMQEDIDRVQEFHKCIECFLCQDVCHVIRDHPENKKVFAGPRFFVRYAALEMHPLDTNDRRELLKEQMGLGMCNITKCCTEVCPEGIKITDNAIIPLKERVVDEFFDPVRWVWSKVTGGGSKEG